MKRLLSLTTPRQILVRRQCARFALASFLIIASGCGGSTAPDPLAQWNGDWNAVTLNGSPLPATYTTNYTLNGVNYSFQTRAVSRRLTIIGTGGIFTDSTEMTSNGRTDYFGGGSFIKWSIAGNQITVVSASPCYCSRDFTTSFTVQSDGSLLNTDFDGANVIYRK